MTNTREPCACAECTLQAGDRVHVAGEVMAVEKPYEQTDNVLVRVRISYGWKYLMLPPQSVMPLTEYKE